MAAIAIFREAAMHFFEPREIDAPGLGIALNVVASTINAVWGWRLIHIGRRERSPALDAGGQHVLSDAVSSAGVVVGLIAGLLAQAGSSSTPSLPPALAFTSSPRAGAL